MSDLTWPGKKLSESCQTRNGQTPIKQKKGQTPVRQERADLLSWKGPDTCQAKRARLSQTERARYMLGRNSHIPVRQERTGFSFQTIKKTFS